MLKVCSEIYADDGIHPKYALKKSSYKKQRKCQQLCGQVMRSMNLVLRGQSDSVLQNLSVVSVDPFPKTSRLLVTLTYATQSDVLVSEVLEKLRQLHGKIQSEVAGDIHRRKTPSFSFRII